MGEKDKSSRLINEMKWAANEENKMRAKYMKKDDEMEFFWIKIEELTKDKLKKIEFKCNQVKSSFCQIS